MENYEALALFQSGLYTLGGVSALAQGNLQARAAALQGRWAETQALYDEAAANDELLAGMAQANLDQAASGFKAGAQLARTKANAASEADKVRRRIGYRARTAAARARLEGGNARMRGVDNALNNIGMAVENLRTLERQRGG